jgi:hypothetical protein
MKKSKTDLQEHWKTMLGLEGATGLDKLKKYIAADERFKKATADIIKEIESIEEPSVTMLNMDEEFSEPVVTITVEAEEQDEADIAAAAAVAAAAKDKQADINIDKLLARIIDQPNSSPLFNKSFLQGVNASVNKIQDDKLKYKPLAAGFKFLAIASLAVGALALTAPISLPAIGVISVVAIACLAVGLVGYTAVNIASSMRSSAHNFESKADGKRGLVVESPASNPLYSRSLGQDEHSSKIVLKTDLGKSDDKSLSAPDASNSSNSSDSNNKQGHP